MPLLLELLLLLIGVYWLGNHVHVVLFTDVLHLDECTDLLPLFHSLLLLLFLLFFLLLFGRLELLNQAVSVLLVIYLAGGDIVLALIEPLENILIIGGFVLLLLGPGESVGLEISAQQGGHTRE